MTPTTKPAKTVATRVTDMNELTCLVVAVVLVLGFEWIWHRARSFILRRSAEPLEPQPPSVEYVLRVIKPKVEALKKHLNTEHTCGIDWLQVTVTATRVKIVCGGGRIDGRECELPLEEFLGYCPKYLSFWILLAQIREDEDWEHDALAESREPSDGRG